jgi:ATP-dependent Lhr-like helicase
VQGGTPAPDAAIVNPSARLTSAIPVDADVTLDYVGSVINAATVVSKLHAGEKRLVFCESRAQAEKMAASLRENNILTFVSHSSLSRDERMRSEQAFAEARDCVVVATSTLELGIDVGDLDRVIQLDSPRTVASFLQRLGRTGRRPGSTRNTIFLATRDDSLIQAAALLRLWREGFVEAIVPPPQPRHIAAQQFLALALQEGALNLSNWRHWWSELSFMAEAQDVLDYLVSSGFLAVDGARAFVGDAAETEFGRRNFMDLTAVFTADPELRVVFGRSEIGTISPLALSRGDDGSPAVLLLGGRRWMVTHVDWRAKVVSVAEAERGGRSQWTSLGLGSGLSARLAGSVREVLLGADPDVEISHRAAAQLVAVRAEKGASVDPDGMVYQRTPTGTGIWTFAGFAANTSLAAALEKNGIEARAESLGVFSPHDLTVAQVRECGDELASASPPKPVITPTILEGLKFSAALPVELATATIVARITDPEVAAQVARAPAVVVS